MPAKRYYARDKKRGDTVYFRVPNALLDSAQEAASDYGVNLNEYASLCVEAMTGMIGEVTPTLPNLVRAIRALRAAKATLQSPSSPLAKPRGRPPKVKLSGRSNDITKKVP